MASSTLGTTTGRIPSRCNLPLTTCSMHSSLLVLSPYRSDFSSGSFCSLLKSDVCRSPDRTVPGPDEPEAPPVIRCFLCAPLPPQLCSQEAVPHSRDLPAVCRASSSRLRRIGDALFFGVQKSFWWTQKTKVIFLGYKMFFGDTKCFFGIQKIILDIVDGQKRQGWGSTVGDPKSSRKSRKQQHTKQEKQHEEAEAAKTTESTNNRNISTNNRSRTSRSKLHKQQRANSTNTRKSTKSISKTSTNMKNSTNSSKAAQNNSKSSAPRGTQSGKASQATARAAQTSQTATKTAPAATETRGPRRRAPKVSLCSHWHLLWNLGGVFVFFFSTGKFS